jgi:D-proline reductase (dithiol) PrdB
MPLFPGAERHQERAGAFANPFLSIAERRIAKAWSVRERPETIPWTPLSKPLSACRVALVSSAAVVRTDDRPFDQQIERQDPWWSDQSYHVIPAGTTEQQIRLLHLHISTHVGEQDLDVVLPIRRLHELAAQGAVGAVAPSHYSFGGYILKPRDLLSVSAAAMARRMCAEAVDTVVLVPV